MQARACNTLSQSTHQSRPKSWATAHGDARAVEHEVVVLRRPARREPAREAREGRGGVSKVVAVRCEEGWLWGTGWHWCERARPRRADSAPRPPSPSTIAPHDAPLSAHESTRAANLPQGALASGRVRAGVRDERDQGGVWSKRAVGGGAGGNAYGDAAASSIGGRGVRRAGGGRAGEGVVAPGQKRALLLLQLGGLASAIDGGVGGVILVVHDEDPSTRSPHFSCHAGPRADSTSAWA